MRRKLDFLFCRSEGEKSGRLQGTMFSFKHLHLCQGLSLPTDMCPELYISKEKSLSDLFCQEH